MRLSGGHDIPLGGAPSGSLVELPEPKVLYLPLRSRRFVFSELCVSDGERVSTGRTLARAPASSGVPLIAPRGGTARLDAKARHIVLEDVTREPEEACRVGEGPVRVRGAGRGAGTKRQRLLSLGAWQFLYDAHTGAVPDPRDSPRAVIASTLALEPFEARGDVQLRGRLGEFARGLRRIVELVADGDLPPRVHVVLPRVGTDLSRRMKEMLRGCTGLRIEEVPLRYPFDHPAVLARALGLRRELGRPVWALRTEGVLAFDRALSLSLPCTERIVSLGGPGVREPAHVRAVTGYPLGGMLSSRISPPPVRVLAGGVMTGGEIGVGDREGELGLGAECTGLTVLPERTEREFLGFLRPGWGRPSYSGCFLSALRLRPAERLTTAMRGARRACVSCGHCEEVCPVGLMPHLVHKHLYRGALEEAARAGVELCAGCGLCSYVCPSKIELRRELADAKAALSPPTGNDVPPERRVAEPEAESRAPAPSEEVPA